MAERISHYELLDRLGAGGMGTVWRARDTRTRTVVALKVLHQHLASDPEYVKRFEREARIAASLESPYVVRVLEFGRDRQTYFLAMEYVEGQTLAQRIKERGPLPTQDAVTVAVAVASALAAARKLGVVHRDIKPQNIMLARDGGVKVTDFGVARATGQTTMTMAGSFIGTPAYMAPEVVEATAVDVRADIYSLGVVLYEMLAGRVPFDADTPWGMIRQHERQAPPPLAELAPEAPDWLVRVCERCLAKLPNDRFRDPEQLLAGLSVQAEPPAQARPQTGRPPTQIGKRSLVLLGVASAAVVAAVVAFAVSNAEEERSSPASVFESFESLPAGIATPEATAGSLPTTEPGSGSAPAQRFNCQEIRGTDYRSDAEREWYQANCSLLPTSSPRAQATFSPIQIQPTMTAVPRSGIATLTRAEWYESTDPVNGTNATNTAAGACNFSKPLGANALPSDRSVCLYYAINTAHPGPFLFKLSFSYLGQTRETPGFTQNGPLPSAAATFKFTVPGPLHFEFLVDGLTAGSTDAVVGP
jgi:serine/threonine protein kinase